MTIFALSAQTPLSTVDAILHVALQLEKFRRNFSSLDFESQRMRENDRVPLMKGPFKYLND